MNSSPGNVGIGSITPGYKLSIKGPSVTTATGTLQLTTPGSAQGENSGVAFYSTFEGTGDNGPRRTADILAGFDSSAWGGEYLTLNVGKNGSSNDSESVTNEKVRITSSGNVGVGTNNPLSTLHVEGQYGSNAALIVDQLNNGNLFTASYSGTTKFTISNARAIGFSGSYGNSGDCLKSGGGSGSINTWGSCGSGVNWWNELNGALSPLHYNR